jgi:hypothetical protein
MIVFIVWRPIVFIPKLEIKCLKEDRGWDSPSPGASLYEKNYLQNNP